MASVKNFSPSHAWDAKVVEHSALPPRVLAVDKKEQLLTVLEFQTSLESTTTYLCSTGQTPGDKIIEGDLKTPEGVYFVVQHLTSGLDFTMYGYEAYTLNYPNPVDKLRKKTGYGIWLHGKGNGIAPLQTQGCVALNNNDLSTLGKKLAPGMPVIISNSVDMHTLSADKISSIRRLQTLSQEWARSWGNRSSSMFDFYDHEAYSLANEPFSAFKSNKERLFKRLPWIKTSIRDIQVLEGPGYWVTWFYQDYQAPNLTSRGVRRLYWSDDKKGNFKIIGMEWVPGLNTSAQMAKEDPATPAIEVAPKTETVLEKFETITADIDSSLPSQQKASAPAPDQTTGKQSEPPLTLAESTTGGVLGAAHSSTLITAKPGASGLPQPGASAKETHQIDAKQESSPPPAQADAGRHVDPASSRPVESAPVPPVVDISDQEVLQLIEKWRVVWQHGDLNGYLAFYADNAKQGKRKSKQAIASHKKVIWNRAHPKTVDLSNITLKRQGDTITATMRQKYRSSDGNGDTGKKTLYFKRFGEKWLIVDEVWSAN